MSDVLYLTLKKKWFDMIESGIKKEEYREIKQYWIKRLLLNEYYVKYFKAVNFKNGYQKNAPEMEFEITDIVIGKGNKDWGAPEENVFIIKLGSRIK